MRVEFCHTPDMLQCIGCVRRTLCIPHTVYNTHTREREAYRDTVSQSAVPVGSCRTTEEGRRWLGGCLKDLITHIAKTHTHTHMHARGTSVHTQYSTRAHESVCFTHTVYANHTNVGLPERFWVISLIEEMESESHVGHHL